MLATAKEFYDKQRQFTTAKVAEHVLGLANEAGGGEFEVSLNGLARLFGGVRRTYKHAVDLLIKDGMIERTNDGVIGATFKYRLAKTEFEVADPEPPKEVAPKAEKPAPKSGKKAKSSKKAKTADIESAGEPGDISAGINEHDVDTSDFDQTLEAADYEQVPFTGWQEI